MSKLTLLYEKLKNQYDGNDPNIMKTLNLIKLELAQSFYLTPKSSLDEDEALAARNILEISAYLMIKQSDIQGFERAYSQLQNFYTTYSFISRKDIYNHFIIRNYLPDSKDESKFRGLYFMNLLAQNRIADFHLALEGIAPEIVENNHFLAHSVNLEKALMEGSYNKVLNARENIPSPEFMFFMDLLASTIRDEIASCCEKAYISLPIQQVTGMLFFSKNDDTLSLAKQRGWTINIDETITFKSDSKDEKSSTLPVGKILEQAMFYAKEMERIV